MRTGGQLVVEGLQRWGVDVVFGLPGVQLDWLFDALADDSGIRVVHPRHEQATAYMADGYARATGRVGVCGYFARNGFPSYSPRTYIGSGYQGTLRFGFPTALGVKVGRPDRAVVSLSGDGGFMYNVAELATAVQHGIGVVVLVFDDGAFGNVKRIQSRTFGREIASTLTNPDFVALAQSFGVKGYRAEGPDALAESVTDALVAGGPALVHVPIGPQPEIWGILSGRETLVSFDPELTV